MTDGASVVEEGEEEEEKGVVEEEIPYFEEEAGKDIYIFLGEEAWVLVSAGVETEVVVVVKMEVVGMATAFLLH